MQQHVIYASFGERSSDIFVIRSQYLTHRTADAINIGYLPESP